MSTLEITVMLDTNPKDLWINIEELSRRIDIPMADIINRYWVLDPLGLKRSARFVAIHQKIVPMLTVRDPKINCGFNIVNIENLPIDNTLWVTIDFVSSVLAYLEQSDTDPVVLEITETEAQARNDILSHCFINPKRCLVVVPS